MGVTDRLFFAIFPDPQAAVLASALAERLRGEYGLKGKPLAGSRFHVSLYHVGDYAGLPEDAVAVASRVADFIALPAFHVVFDRALSFPSKSRNRPLVLLGGEGADALKELHRALKASAGKAGLARGANQSFRAHMTLLYDDLLVPEQSISPVGWTVSEFVLVHSLLGKSRYELLGHWPLSG